MKRIPSNSGLLYYFVKQIRPDLAKKIDETGIAETAVIGLGTQGTKHAGLMQEYGTKIAAAIAPGKEGTRVHETIPIYDSVANCLKEHPNIVAASIWKHFSSAREAAIEAIEGGIPIVVVISEGIPLRDVRDMLDAAKQHKTLVLGGNTPGIIFPPEGIKVGMLPDVFYPEEVDKDSFGPKGVTIISRSGAILYHLSDGLASVGIAQNAVIGVGGDGAVGASVRKMVPLVMGYEHTDLIVIAGEIGGYQEELLAQDILNDSKKYPKPIVAVISGANAPEGKTMGHAGAIVAPGQEFGTFKSKKEALEKAGVTVVNSQYDLIEKVREKLGGKRYFNPENYFRRMREIWEAKPPKPTWGTLITKIEPDNIVVSGYRLRDLVEKKSFLETLHLLVKGKLPDDATLSELNRIALQAAKLPPPDVPKGLPEDLSKTLAKYLLLDEQLAGFPQGGSEGPVRKTAFAVGRAASYFAKINGLQEPFAKFSDDEPFANIIYTSLTGAKQADENRKSLLEAMVVACVDHGVTPPSAQATLIAASVRAAYEVAVAHGVGAITDVHGGAGANAATFFLNCVSKAESENISLEDSVRNLVREYVKAGKPIEGLGHRVHKQDPRRDVLWKLADKAGVSGKCVAISKFVSEIFEEVRGITLPINVDGVIGAIIADMTPDVKLAKAIFIFGRLAGLSAHYFEEITSQPRMRQIVFANAVYKGNPAAPIQ